MAAIPVAYEELAKRLKTDQIIWCYTAADQYRKHGGDSRVEWIIDVPDDRILAIVDTWIWERIIQSKAIPPVLLDAWKAEAVRSDHDYAAYLQLRMREYLSQPAPEGGWWCALFVQWIHPEDTSVLVRHPIPEVWVSRHG